MQSNFSADMLDNLYLFLLFFSELWLNLLALIIIGVAISLAMVPTFEKVLDAAEWVSLF